MAGLTKTVQPNDHYVFARPLEAESKTESGILLPDSAREKIKTAEVINVGANVTGFKAKDVVVYKEYTTTDISLNRNAFIVIEDKDILGKVVEIGATDG